MKAIEKYQHYENHQMNKDTLGEMIKVKIKDWLLKKIWKLEVLNQIEAKRSNMIFAINFSGRKEDSYY